jgi:hypothetical protein
MHDGFVFFGGVGAPVEETVFGCVLGSKENTPYVETASLRLCMT